MNPRMSPDKLWKLVEKARLQDGCFELHHGMRRGYPFLWIDNKLYKISRLILERELGRKISLALHRCNTRACINPKHIYEGNYKQNAQDSMKAGTFHNYGRLMAKK